MKTIRRYLEAAAFVLVLLLVGAFDWVQFRVAYLRSGARAGYEQASAVIRKAGRKIYAACWYVTKTKHKLRALNQVLADENVRLREQLRRRPDDYSVKEATCIIDGTTLTVGGRPRHQDEVDAALEYFKQANRR